MKRCGRGWPEELIGEGLIGEWAARERRRANLWLGTQLCGTGQRPLGSRPVRTANCEGETADGLCLSLTKLRRRAAEQLLLFLFLNDDSRRDHHHQARGGA